MTDRNARNVVLVVMDTVRKDTLSVYGYDRPTSPALERFAEEATVFEQAVSQAPWTLPVHASLFTGLYPGEHGASQETPYLSGATTLAETLSRAGYETACFTSNAWITPYTGLTRGFDETDNFFEVLPGDFLSGPLAKAWRACNDSPPLRTIADRLVRFGNDIHEHLASDDAADSKTPQVIDRTIEFVDRARDPYFVFANLMDAHLPYYPPDEYAREFAPGIAPDDVCQNSKEYNSGARDIDDDEWEAIRGLYAAEIRHLDAELGRLMEWLREHDDGETLVVICADHGELHGEHELYGHEFCIYDPLVNVPLLISHPDLDTGVRTDQVELLDVYHTVLDHAGVSSRDPQAGFDRGRSLLSKRYRQFSGGEYAFVEYYRPTVELAQLESKARRGEITLNPDSRFYSRMRAVRRVDAKYIRNERISNEFYRLGFDPGELTDRRGSGGRAEHELTVALAEFESSVDARWAGTTDGTGSLDDMDEAAKARLRELGYLE